MKYDHFLFDEVKFDEGFTFVLGTMCKEGLRLEAKIKVVKEYSDYVHVIVYRGKAKYSSTVDKHSVYSKEYLVLDTKILELVGTGKELPYVLRCV